MGISRGIIVSMTETPAAGEKIYRHSIIARTTHWCWTLAMLVLVMSGLQIFVAAPYLDASDKSNPDRRILAIDAHQDASGKPVGTTTIFGHTFVTTHVLGYTDDGQGGESERAFPGALTLPATQDLASGRTWHLFFAWVLTLSIIAYLISAYVRKDLRELILRRSDLPKLWPMQLYYFRLRKDPPPHGKYNPLQKGRLHGRAVRVYPADHHHRHGAFTGHRRDQRPARVDSRRPPIRAHVAFHVNGDLDRILCDPHGARVFDRSVE